MTQVEHDSPNFAGTHQEGQTVEYEDNQVRLQMERELRSTQFKADCAAIVSGGLDSITMVYHLLSLGRRPHMLSFNYGQRHGKEIFYAQAHAKSLNLPHDIIDLTSITRLISASSLTGNIEVPDGHYAEETMKATVVPNRNMMMLSIAAAIAVNNSYHGVATGVHSGDHFIYPDCRPDFIIPVNAAIVRGNAGFGAIHDWNADLSNSPQEFVMAPFLYMTKADIAYRALELDVPIHLTWSCYKGGENHCGKCGTCVERLEAVTEAMQRRTLDLGHTALENGISPNIQAMDQTRYDDKEFWKTAKVN